MTRVGNQAGTTVRKRAKGYELVDIVVFLIPCMEFVQIQLIGVLNGSDLLLLATFIYLAFRGRIRIATPAGKKCLIFCSLWLGSQCVTDIVRHSAFGDYARGWSNIGLTLVNFAVLGTLLYGRNQRLLFYGWGLILGSLLRFFINPDIFAAEYPWKFGFGFPATLAVFLFASRKGCRDHWPLTLSIFIGIVNIGMGLRSVGGICLAGGLYQLVTRILRKKATGFIKLNARAIGTVAASIILGAITILWAYRYAASTGMLGEEARTKYENQSSGQYGMLLGGRKEMLGYLPAIYDSPILGHGSWARDLTYLLAEHQALAELGYKGAWDLSPDDLEEGLIPTHSYLFGAWVDAGILGALFWVWVLVLTASALMRVYPPTVTLLPVVSYIGFQLLWGVLFSPYGAEVRIIFPYFLVVLMTAMSMAPRKSTQVATTGARIKATTQITA